MGYKDFLAGGFAGMTEAMIFYPSEFVKTQMQLYEKGGKQKTFTSPVQCLKYTMNKNGIIGLYSGASTLLFGTFAKAAVRFSAFDYYRGLLKNDNGALTPSRSFCAGLLTGMTEAILVVTPVETLKTRIIDDQNSKSPRFKGLSHAIKTLVAEDGLGSIYKGLTATMMRQAANSAVRFTIYGAIKERILAGSQPHQKKLTLLQSFGSGLVAGVINVYLTQPLDVLKTRMQGLEASKYRNTGHCFSSILKNEGVLQFWAGATPRFSRVGFSGAVVFTAFEQYLTLLDYLFPEDS